MGSNYRLSFSFYVIVLISLQVIGCASYPQKKDFLACDFSPIKVEHFSTNEKSSLSQQLIEEPICTGTDYSTFKNADALVISGGAADGAFGAGFISKLVMENKMAVRGNDDLPHPCIITGVSTGALMSPFVYLATSLDAEIKTKDYATLLHELYSQLDDEKLLSPKNALFQIYRLIQKKSLYSADAVKQEIESRFTDDVIKDIASEYKNTKRKIFIGVTNINTGNFEIVDLTKLFELANDSKSQVEKDHNKHCVFAAIRGSTSIPIAFEPVAVQDKNEYKLLVDGGIRYPLFLHKQMIKALKKVGQKDGLQEKSVRTYVVINHFGLTDQFLKNHDFNDLNVKEYISNNIEIARSQLYLDASNTLYQLTKSECLKSYWVDAQSENVCVKPKGKYFHIPYQNCLINSGKEKANEENPWSLEPSLTPILLK